MSYDKKPLASEFAKQGEQYIGTPYKMMDCQAFVEKMLADVGVKKNWRGSNAMYRDMAWVGSPEECKKKFGRIPAGAWLFIHDNNGGEPSRYHGDGMGNASHVGVKTGTGQGAIHSSSSRGCVAESKFNDKTIRNGGWNAVGFCKLLDYGPEIEAKLYGETMQDEPAEKESEMIKVAITTVRVKTSRGGPLNLRSTPKQTSSNRICGIPNDTLLPVLEKTSDAWWKVEYNGKSGYVSTEYIVELDNAEVLTEDGAVCITLEKDAAVRLRDALDKALGGAG